MRQPLRALCAATALGLGLTALAACSDDPDPRIGGDDDPSTEAAPPESSEPATTAPATDGTTATEPTEPPSSEAPEGETAGDFIKRWYAVSDTMQTTGETAAFNALGSNCSECETLAETVEGYYEAGGYIDFGGSKVIAIDPPDSGGEGAYLVTARVAPTRYKTSAKARIERFPRGTETLRIELRRGPTGWSVTSYLRV